MLPDFHTETFGLAFRLLIGPVVVADAINSYDGARPIRALTAMDENDSVLRSIDQ